MFRLWSVIFQRVAYEGICQLRGLPSFLQCMYYLRFLSAHRSQFKTPQSERDKRTSLIKHPESCGIADCNLSAFLVNKQNKAWQGRLDSTVNFHSTQSEKHFDSITAVSSSVTGSRAGITNFQGNKGYQILAQFNCTSACHSPVKNQRLESCCFCIFLFAT